MLRLGLKIDVDTERGTRLGVPRLLNLFEKFHIKATFLFSLGPDNTGRALKRIFKPGFLKKVNRTQVISTYGLRTLCNGILLPGPLIQRKHQPLLQQVAAAKHEVGIHCYDHVYWQDNLHRFTFDEIQAELNKAQAEFIAAFGNPAHTIGAAGWQANALSLRAYDTMNLQYASDTRGYAPFFPTLQGTRFNTLQIPTTLPTLDEILGRREYPLNSLHTLYLSLIKPNAYNVMTLHAELEGMKYYEWFQQLLILLQQHAVHCCPLRTFAEELSHISFRIPRQELLQGTIDGRAGYLAVQSREMPDLETLP